MTIAIGKHGPTDATTNPSLILQAASKDEYFNFLSDLVKGYNSSKMKCDIDIYVIVNFGIEILKRIPGRVSSEVNAKYSKSYYNIIGTHLIPMLQFKKHC